MYVRVKKLLPHLKRRTGFRAYLGQSPSQTVLTFPRLVKGKQGYQRGQVRLGDLSCPAGVAAARVDMNEI